MNQKLVATLGQTRSQSMHAMIVISEKSQKIELIDTSTLTTIESVDLNSCNVMDKGLALLAPAVNMNPMTTLDLGLNGIGNEGAIALALALEGTPCRLTTLNLSHNSIKDNGCVKIAMAIALESCPVITLDMTDNIIADEGALAIANAIKQETCCVAKLLLSLNCIGYQGSVSLAEALEADACKVVTFDLGRNKPGPGKAGKQRLAQAFASTMRLHVT